MSEKENLAQLTVMIQNEEAAGRLYAWCAKKVPALDDFFRKLVDEELDHARVLADFHKKVQSKDVAVDTGRFSMLAVEAFAQKIDDLIVRVQKASVSERNVLEMALEVEDAFLEKDFFEVIENDADQLKDLLGALKKMTKDHRERVRQRLREVTLGAHAPGVVTFSGASLHCAGRPLVLGRRASSFSAVDTGLKPAGLGAFAGKVKILTSFPSLDTPVCDLQVKEFNKKAATFSDDVVIVGISCDLPFAQKRFCQANSIDKVTTLSDYQSLSFGSNYGLLIKELKLLARAVVIVDKNDVIRYIQIVPELTQSPDYEEILKALKSILASPAQDAPEAGHCVVCEGGISSLSESAVTERLGELSCWESIKATKIKKQFSFSHYGDVQLFAHLIAEVAKAEGHHPSVRFGYNKLTVILTTHAAGGLTENDFVMAGIIDAMYTY